MFDPWLVLRGQPHIRLEWATLEGRVGETNGVDLIRLDTRLLQVERRCVLTHELVHVAAAHRGCQPVTVERGVRRRCSELLIHVQDLRRELRWARSMGELAAELWVTERVLEDRLTHLTQQERNYLATGETAALTA
ncbi:ImmA/IrrE family metallo-endopeptidase [Arthrobacter sp. zg-Y20]|uniref:ImmA/IrrE family metallo-endopeptidase n=1 Tax=unclassified Arthrobacter TaxID=235627 RepID=UPI001D1599F4|nr:MULTISPECIES: ImmA/IrrE family metallo-endopeptidase [unclassified Arthrobacter]MCC3277484.1 ImmA/IrrE family metallo-endopeptidase [Arthrobacter sp. zg-Y20]MDK1317645.1 ImmA/IrrE family metallo-endopeptidase [Arthrobacter sp. zg.Y20]WIB07095.1 ImmA/IrrE family metallo-endopeptidase [Arthrobacter sp. zg-Y20]